MKRTRAAMLIVAALVGIPALIFGIYVAVNFIIPSLVTEVAVTGVPTARSNATLDAIRTSQAATRSATTQTPSGGTRSDEGVLSVSYSEPSDPYALAQELYRSCTADRGITATPSDQPTPTEAPVIPTGTPAPAPSGDPNFVLLNIVGEESEACYQIGEILRGQYTVAIGVSKQISGEVAIDLNNVANSLIGEEIVVNLAELRSDQGNRDRWMISRQGFNFNEKPFARLTNARLEGLPAMPYTEGDSLGFKIIGDLTVNDTTVETTFTAFGYYKDNTLVLTAYTDTKLTTFGLTPPDLGVVKANDEVRIILNLVARPQ